MTSANASLPISGFNLRLSDLQMVGYGALFVAYNVGLSPIFGVVRLLIAVPYYLKHKKDAEVYQKVHEVVIENKDSALNADKRGSLELKLATTFTNLKQKIFKWYAEVTHDQMMKFWFLQIVRGLSEIFIPHVGPQIWTFRDFTCEGIFKSRLSMQIGIDSPSKSDKSNDEFLYTFQLNVAGNRELEKAMKWEDEYDKTISSEDIDLKATLRSTRKKKIVKGHVLEGSFTSKVKSKLNFKQQNNIDPLSTEKITSPSNIKPTKKIKDKMTLQ